MTTRADAAFKQLDVIHALALRETRTRFGQHQLGYVWALVEPLLWIGTFWVIYAYTHRVAPSGMDLVSFLATGFVPYQVFTKTVDNCGSAISANKPLLFFPQVYVLDVIAARTYLELSTDLMVFALIMGGRALVTGATDVDNVLMILTGFGLASLLGSGVGLVWCTLSVMSRTMDRIKSALLRPLFWTSGIFYTVDTLPLRMREALAWNPVLHIVELVRDGWHASYSSPVIDVPYVLAWIAGLFLAGLTLERRVRHLIHAE